MKLTGILILGFIISLYGFFSANRLSLANKQLEKIIKLIGVIKLKISYRDEKVMEIIDNLSAEYDFLFLKLNCSFEKYFKKICFENKGLVLADNEKLTLFNFLDSLGKTDLQNQINLCENYIKIFEEILQERKEKSKSKIKLYPSLSILSGLLVVLILV